MGSSTYRSKLSESVQLRLVLPVLPCPNRSHNMEIVVPGLGTAFVGYRS